MKFIPKSEDDLNRIGLIPDGDYPFTVIESNEQASKSEKNAGRIMCALKLAVHSKEGRDQWVFDYFADWFSEWKLKRFAETTGHSKNYEFGNLDVNNNAAQGWTGYVRIKTETDNKGKDKNVVDDYIVMKTEDVKKSKQTVKVDNVEFDDIAF